MELKRKQRAYFKYGPLPKEGITLSLETQTGHVNLYAADKIKNPNSALNDYQIEDNGSVFISSGGLHGGHNVNNTLYVTAEGIGNGFSNKDKQWRHSTRYKQVYNYYTIHNNSYSSRLHTVIIKHFGITRDYPLLFIEKKMSVSKLLIMSL